MDKNVYVYVFDGFADWEPALALCELKQRGGFAVKTLAESLDPILSRGGLRILPDMTVDSLACELDGMLILPGGDIWESTTPPLMQELLAVVHERQLAVAAICGATVAVARAGLLEDVRHTSNGRGYLLQLAPGYAGKDLYVEGELAVRDKHVITASGAGHVEFAREIITSLGLYDEHEATAWFDLFKHGVMPNM